MFTTKEKRAEISSVARVSRSRSYVHAGGLIWIYVDHDAFEFYVDAAVGHAGADMAEVLSQLAAWGLEPDWELVEIVGEGMVRTVFSPIIPLSDTEIAWLTGEGTTA